jgi:hypothetical protein
MLVNVQALRALAAFLVVFVHLERLADLAGLPPGATVFALGSADASFPWRLATLRSRRSLSPPACKV